MDLAPLARPQLEPYRTVNDAAYILSRGRDKIVELIKSGELHAVNIGTDRREVWRLTDDDIREFIQNRSSPAA